MNLILQFGENENNLDFLIELLGPALKTNLNQKLFIRFDGFPWNRDVLTFPAIWDCNSVPLWRHDIFKLCWTFRKISVIKEFHITQLPGLLSDAYNGNLIKYFGLPPSITVSWDELKSFS